MADTTYLELDGNNQAIVGPFVVDPDLLNPPDTAVAIDGVVPTPQIGWTYNPATQVWTEDTLPVPVIVIDIARLRNIRNKKLQESDWIASRHFEGRDPVGFDWNSWDIYRQALRDITEGYTSTAEEDINWPIEPINS